MNKAYLWANKFKMRIMKSQGQDFVFRMSCYQVFLTASKRALLISLQFIGSLIVESLTIPIRDNSIYYMVLFLINLYNFVSLDWK